MVNECELRVVNFVSHKTARLREKIGKSAIKMQ
jgi:hypothetical protein